jgi:hypothetical protein
MVDTQLGRATLLGPHPTPVPAHIEPEPAQQLGERRVDLKAVPGLTAAHETFHTRGRLERTGPAQLDVERAVRNPLDLRPVQLVQVLDRRCPRPQTQPPQIPGQHSVKSSPTPDLDEWTCADTMAA